MCRLGADLNLDGRFSPYLLRIEDQQSSQLHSIHFSLLTLNEGTFSEFLWYLADCEQEAPVARDLDVMRRDARRDGRDVP
jgi:hypothetical protein